jgi:iron complex outermembrane receptor protein
MSPLALGSAAPGGAINLVTLSATSASEARTALGSWDTMEARASVSGVRGTLASLLHFGYQGSRGDFVYADDNGTPFNALDDSLSRRLNNRFDSASGLASVTWRPSAGVRIGAREDLFQKIQGVPGLGQVPALHPRLAFLRSLTQLDGSWDGARVRPTVSVRGSFQHERTQFRDTNAELGLGRHDTNDHVNGGGAALELVWRTLPLGFTVRGLGELREDHARLADGADGLPDPGESRRVTRGASAGLEWRPVGDDVVLMLAQRWDRLTDRVHTNGLGSLAQNYEITRELQSPQIGFAVHGPLGLEVRANSAQSTRAPDFLELFGNQGSVLGNPALQPEHVTSWDTGVVWELPTGTQARTSVEWAHFESYAQDLVLYVKNSPSSVRAQNIARATIAGDELSVRTSGPFGLSASGAFTWQTAIDHGPVPFWSGKRLPQRPAQAGNARVEWRANRFMLGGIRVSDVSLAGMVDMLGDNYLDRYNRQRVGSRTITDASVSFAPFIRALRFTVEGKNLGDRRVYDVAGFPLPGRSWFVACEWRTRATSLN